MECGGGGGGGKGGGKIGTDGISGKYGDSNDRVESKCRRR